MALKHLVLGILREEPAHGYRVAARLLALAGSLRRVETARVYETLGGLEREGAIAARVAADGGRERRVWETTERGREELGRWLDRPVPSADWLRRPLLARLAIAGPSDSRRLAAARSELEARRRALVRLGALPRAGAPATSLRAALDRADRERQRARLEVEVELLAGWIAIGEAGSPAREKAERTGPGVSLPPRRPCPPPARPSSPTPPERASR